MSGLTKALLSLTRQQRHLAMRVVISTQGELGSGVISTIISQTVNTYTEPTALPSVLIDLCSIAILHRFSSPAWWEAIVRHVSADFTDEEAFDHVVRLKVGYANLTYSLSH